MSSLGNALTTSSAFGSTTSLLSYQGTPDALVFRDGSGEVGLGVSFDQATFTAADVGKVIAIAGATAVGGNLSTTIQAILGPHAVRLSDAIGTAVADATFMYGTDNAPGFQTFVDSLGASGVAGVVPPGSYALGLGVNLPLGGVRLSGYGARLWTALLSRVSARYGPHSLRRSPDDPGTPAALVASVTPGATSFQVAGAPFAAGQVVRLLQNGLNDPFRGASYTVVSVASVGGNQAVTVERPILLPYDSATANATLLPQRPVDTLIEGFTLSGACLRYGEFGGAYNCELRNVTIDASAPISQDLCWSWDGFSLACGYTNVQVFQQFGGLGFESSEGCYATRCRVSANGAAGCNGISLEDCTVCVVSDCSASNAGVANLLLASDSGTSGIGCTDCIVRGGNYGASAPGGVPGVWIDVGTGNIIDGVLVERNSGTGIYVDNSAIGTKLVGCRVRFNLQAGIVVQNTSQGTLIVGCEASNTQNGNPNLQLNGPARVVDFFSSSSTGNDSVLITQVANCTLDGFSVTIGTQNGARAIGIAGSAYILSQIKHGRIVLPATPGNTQRGIYSTNGGVTVVDDVEVIATGGGTTSGCEQVTGNEILRPGKLRADTCSSPLVIAGFCSKSVPGSVSANSVTLNGTTAVAVPWPDLKSSDRVQLTLRTRGATPGSGAVLVNYTPGTGFSLTGNAAGVNDVYDYAIG